MGRDTVETVRDFFELRNRGQIPAATTVAGRREAAQALASALHPEVEFDMSRSRSPYRGVYRGREEVAKLFEEVGEAWAEIEWKAEEFIEVDEDTVVVPTRLSGRGKGSGIELGGEGAGIWSVRDGKIARFVLCQDRDEALELAGANSRE